MLFLPWTACLLCGPPPIDHPKKLQWKKWALGDHLGPGWLRTWRQAMCLGSTSLWATHLQAMPGLWAGLGLACFLHGVGPGLLPSWFLDFFTYSKLLLRSNRDAKPQQSSPRLNIRPPPFLEDLILRALKRSHPHDLGQTPTTYG